MLFLLKTQKKNLNQTLETLKKPFEAAIKKKDYNEAYSLLAKIQQPLAKLFEGVKILADDPNIQNNRIALLQKVFNLFHQLLDFSKIQG